MKAISLFSGMGGDTLGMKNAGIEVIAYNENIPKFIETHDLNFNSELINDNGKTDITQISDDIFLKYNGIVNLIFAGFPCQGFSHGGKKLPDDPRNTLFREFVRATELICPEFIIGENVEGLLSRKTETGEKYIDVIVSSFEEIGYKIKFKVIKAETCGVPQLRRRLIIIGVHESIDYDYKFPNVENVSKCKLDFLEKSLKGAVCVSNIYNDKSVDAINVDVDDREPSDTVHPYVLSILNKEPEYNGKTFDCLLSYSKRESPTHLEIVNRNNPSKTIICSYDHQPRLLVPLRYENELYIRPFNVNELKQIQGFPKEFLLSGNTKNQIVQIGNAVPPNLVTFIVRDLVRFFQTIQHN